MSRHGFFTPVSTNYKSLSYGWIFVFAVKLFLFALSSVIFLLTWSILPRCSYTQATNFFSRSESKHSRLRISSRCLLDLAEIIFFKIHPQFYYTFRFYAKFLCCWSVTVFHRKFDNCFFNSIVNALLFCPLCDITYLETKLNLICLSNMISRPKIVSQCKIFHDF